MTRPPPRQIVIRPTPVGDVTWARASHDSVLGRVECHWERDARRFLVKITVPASATLVLPDGSERVVEAGSFRFEIEHGRST
jgi:alpha-L-rhamnosidase